MNFHNEDGKIRFLKKNESEKLLEIINSFSNEDADKITKLKFFIYDYQLLFQD
jgi:hypothetical protein